MGFLSHEGAPLLNGLQRSCSLKGRLDDGLQAPTHLLLLLEPPFLQVSTGLSNTADLCTCLCGPCRTSSLHQTSRMPVGRDDTQQHLTGHSQAHMMTMCCPTEAQDSGTSQHMQAFVPMQAQAHLVKQTLISLCSHWLVCRFELLDSSCFLGLCMAPSFTDSLSPARLPTLDCTTCSMRPTESALALRRT